jgi:hypothetical protein
MAAAAAAAAHVAHARQIQSSLRGGGIDVWRLVDPAPECEGDA